MTLFGLWAFCLLLLSLLFFVIIINNTLLSNNSIMKDDVLVIYGKPTTVYAEQQQTLVSVIKNQDWIDKQSNTKISFSYSPEPPSVGGFTDLKFNIVDLKSGTAYKDVLARVTIVDGQQLQQQQQAP